MERHSHRHHSIVPPQTFRAAGHNRRYGPKEMAGMCFGSHEITALITKKYLIILIFIDIFSN